jgi:hypothetical protein
MTETAPAPPAKRRYHLDRSKTGRSKGTPNRTTRLLKDAILLAAERAGGGGSEGLTAYLQRQADENPGPFMALLAKVLPTQLAADGDGGGVVVQILRFAGADGLVTSKAPSAPLIEVPSVRLLPPTK